MSSLASILKPFVMLMKIFGLPLDNDWSIYGFCYSSWILPIYCTLSLSIDSFINGVMAISAVRFNWGIIRMGLDDPDLEARARSNLARLVNTLYRQFMLSAVPAIFAFQAYATRNWKDLWLNLLNIHEDMKLSRNFIKKCKRRCFLALVVLLLVSIVN